MTPTPALQTLVYRRGDHLIMPGFASAHSHAFQRALRGRTQRRGAQSGSFWSWRELMYRLAAQLDPETLFHFSRFAFIELAMSGVTAIGEFHYLHHAPNGVPYADRLAMSDAVIRAALEAGIRISLLRTAYFQADIRGDTHLAPAQQRFCDDTVDAVLQDADALTQRYANHECVRVGLAAHSLRAVPRPALLDLAIHARRQSMPFHMHVAEQQQEVDQCLDVYGCRPVELLAEDGILDMGVVAVHATHLTPAEIELLGAAQNTICLCRTTERDLGDGLPPTADLYRAGVRFCVGADSHASSDAFEEIRAVELDERSRTTARHVVADAPTLFTAATHQGYVALGLDTAWPHDTVTLDLHDASLAGLSPETDLDGLIFGATPRAVRDVTIAGETVVRDGRHIRYDEARQGYEAALRRLGLLA